MKRVLGAGALVVCGLLAAALPAQAASLDSGLWYFEKGNVQAAHDAGFTGEGVTVAVIDTQINPDAPGLRGANIEVIEPSYCFDENGERLPSTTTDYAQAQHGTHVASLLAGTGEAEAGGVGVKGVAPDAKVLYYTAAISAGGDGEQACAQENGELSGPNGSGMGRAIEDAIDAGADIISVSLSGYLDVNQSIAKALAANVVVVAGMPNVGGVAQWPAGSNGVIAVQAFNQDGEIQSSSLVEGADPTPNLSKDVIVGAPGMGILTQGSPTSWDDQALLDGTSLATPIAAGFLAVTKGSYPDATGNQLIQSLIHNTGGEVDSEPQWGNTMGYGAISLTAMLQVDPAKYPDVNPIFDAENPDAVPSAADVAAVTAEEPPSDQPTDEPADEPAAPQGAEPWVPWAIGGGIVGVLIVVGGIVLAIVLTRASRRSNAEQGGE